MHRRRRQKLIDIAPVALSFRSSAAIRVLRTAEELEAAQDRVRAFERRDAEGRQRLQSTSELARVLPLRKSPELRPHSDLHPAGSGLVVPNNARASAPETMGVDAG
jgi:hypothetical protein